MLPYSAISGTKHLFLLIKLQIEVHTTEATFVRAAESEALSNLSSPPFLVGHLSVLNM